MSTGFEATHEVPAGGMPTWPAPDPAAAPGPMLEGKSRVQLLAYHDDGWANIRCVNGWEAWVDGRELRVENPAPQPGPLVGLGVAVVIGATFLPWVKLPGGSMTAWEMPAKFLLGRADDLGGPKVGLLLLVVAFAAVPFVAKVSLPWYATVSCAAIAVEAVALTLLRVRALTLDADVAIGAVVALVGASFLALDAGMTAARK